MGRLFVYYNDNSLVVICMSRVTPYSVNSTLYECFFRI
nr:MAG TPA: hypothetical protein [Caudoviricetes sp.]